MFVLHDRTRRFWTFVLFLVGGPLLTLLILGLLWFRNGNWAAYAEMNNLSRKLTVPVTLEGVRYLRPSEQIFFGLGLQDPKINQTAIYCPVISFVQHRGTSDRQEFNTHPAAKLDQIAELGKKDSWAKAIIPNIYIRYSAIPRIKFLLNEFLQQTNQTSGRQVVLFEIGEVFVFYSDADFQHESEQRQSLSRAQRWKQAQALLNVDQGKAPPFETVDVSIESIQRWIQKYNEQTSGAQLTHVTGLYQATEQKRRVDFEFRFAQIPTERSAQFSWEFQRNDAKKASGVSRVALRNVKSQMPCSFASMFCPFFFIVGTESWMTGTITAETTCSSEATENETLYQFDDFHLKYCDLAPLAKRVTPRDVSGTVADFYLESAQVQQGVFTGKGLLFLVNGTLEKKFLAKLAEAVPLRFDPASTLANQYKNDEVPFNQLAVSFNFKQEGVLFDSSYPKKIVAFFRNDTAEYGIYLKENSVDTPVPYPKLVAALAMQPDVVPFWSPVYRRAINHLPVEP
ncbi:MAG: hypothetical protein PHQ75_05790 [Thermoguttaceae bacterium]|nr:hypothetical protein [Thermoguttaceae bacterium]